jgi:nucleotide-binding universal stress UspA family protein
MMFHHILVPLDGSSLAERVLMQATALAKAFGARVTFLRVLEEQWGTCLQPVDPLEWEMCKSEARLYLEGLATAFQQAGLQADFAMFEGSAAQRIMDYIQSHKVDLTIISSHGRSGLSEWNSGSVISKIILRSRVSTLIVRAYLPAPQEGAGFERLMVPLDCSKRAECALAPATALARACNSRILIAHVVRRPEMPCRTLPTEDDLELANRLIERNQREARKYFETLRSRMPGDVHIRLFVDENVSGRLHELVRDEKIDLVILSAHGFSGGTKWPYGSVASNFILFGTVPLLVVQDLLPEEVEFSEPELSAVQKKGH